MLFDTSGCRNIYWCMHYVHGQDSDNLYSLILITKLVKHCINRYSFFFCKFSASCHGNPSSPNSISMETISQKCYPVLELMHAMHHSVSETIVCHMSLHLCILKELSELFQRDVVWISPNL